MYVIFKLYRVHIVLYFTRTLLKMIAPKEVDSKDVLFDLDSNGSLFIQFCGPSGILYNLSKKGLPLRRRVCKQNM